MIDQLDCREENSPDDLVGLRLSADGESLDKLFGNCMPRLFRVADCILHNRHDSEDALQDGLLSALRHLDQFKGNSQFSTWMFSIVRNSALANLRKQRAHATVSMDDQVSEDENGLDASEMPCDPRPDPELECVQSELSYRFNQTLDSLPTKYRAIIRLCDLEGVSGKEAARQLGLTASALKARHYRARLAIRESMGEHIARRTGQSSPASHT